MDSETKKRILFVDDEPDLLDSLRDGLRRFRDRWQLSFAGSGEAALEALAIDPADVIVSDMKMPGMDGVELLERVKILHPAAVRIVLSGVASPEVVARAAPAAHRILAKPCDTEELREVLERVCALHDLTREAELYRSTIGATTLPSRPSFFLELSAAIAAEHASADTIASVIEGDAAMTAKALQLANSAFFGSGRSVSRVRDAVLYLGANTIKVLALSAEACAQPGLRAGMVGFSMDRFNSHAAVTARIAASITPAGEAHYDAVAAALLHDIGVLVLLQEEPACWAQVNTIASRELLPVHDVERALNGITHAEIGGYLLALWGLPPAVVEAVAHHHDPAALRGGELDACAVVHIADALACEAGADLHNGARAVCTLDLNYLEELGIESELTAWRELARRVALDGGVH